MTVNNVLDLPTAIGRLLATSSGARLAYLPFDLSVDEAIKIVRAANEQRVEVQPSYAVLMTNADVPNDLLKVTPYQAPMYREGDRLLVVHGIHTDLASNANTYVELLAPSWPEQASGATNLGFVAEQCISELSLTRSGAVADLLERQFLILMEAYRSAGSGANSWNSLWWRHISMSLERLNEAVIAAPASAILDTYLLEVLPACFGLPAGSAPARDAKRIGDALATALRDWWSDSESATEAAIAIQSRRQEMYPATAPAAGPDLTHLDDAAAASGSLLFAWQSTLSGPLGVNWLADLRWEELAAPFGESNQQLKIMSGVVPCANDAISGTLSYLATDIDGAEIASEFVTIRLPFAAQLPRGTSSTRVTLKTIPRSVSFEGRFEIVDGRPALRGQFRTKYASFTPRIVTARVEVPSGDVLSGVLVPAASAQIVLTHPRMPTVSVSILSGAKLTGKPHLAVLDGADHSLTFELPGSSAHRFIVCEPTSSARPQIGNAVPQIWPDRETFHYADVTSPSVLLRVGESEVQFEVRAKSSVHRLLPLLATIDGVPAREGAPPEAAESEIRGRLESDIADRLQDPDDGRWLYGLGHYILPEGETGGSGDFSIHSKEVWITAAEWSERDFKGDHFPVVSEEILSSDAAEAFRHAFRSLGMPARIAEQTYSERTWVSRLDLGVLWDTPELTGYLEAYRNLLNEAQRLGDSAGLFWASYPFSASVWRIDAVAQLRSVLLSPLHPVRLAWLAGVSRGIDAEPDRDSRRRFAGIIEGWNFPHFGPAENATGHLLAVPADHGPEQVFLGWSLAVRAPDQMVPLRVPSLICGLRAPGSSLSGLNGTSVAKAMSDFRRINPFISTLSVDLAASSSTTRMTGIDDAVVHELARWASDEEDALTGGARVWDSINRSGDLPKDAVTTQLSGQGRPLIWSRYDPRKTGSPAANLRILQDAGHVVHVTKGSAEGLTAIGKFPFRRHEVLVRAEANTSVVDSYPGLRPQSGWEPFVEALTTLEQSNLGQSNVIIRSALSSGGLFSGTADWTITGDSMINPSALAAHLASGSTPMALWEWQPPFLAARNASEDTLLERRPYLSVVKVPGSLTGRIQNLMQQSWGLDVGVEPQDVLRELGVRGIGLSSLMAIGGAQAVGALGFFVTLRLLDELQVDDGELLVLPIDACDQYLTALSTHSHTLGDRRRADLLLTHISSNGVVLAPVEIKYYNISQPSHALPASGAAALRGPLEQLASTQKVLMGLSSLPEGALWRSAFASLVEVGMRLNPSAIQDRAKSIDLLASLANGELPIRVGKPILTYFSHGSGTFRLDRCDWAGELGLPQHGELVADAAVVASELFGANTEKPMIQEWQQLVDWAMGEDEAGELIRAGHLKQGPERDPFLSGSVPRTAAVANVPIVTPGLELPSVQTVGQPVAFPEPAPASAPDQPLDEELHVDGVRFVVGDLVDQMGGGEAQYWPANTALTQLNIGVVGNLGTGKTQLLKAIVKNIRDGAHSKQPSPISMLILDYKGDFVSPDFIEAVGGRVLRPHQLPLNYFQLSEPYSPTAAVRKAGSFNEVLSQIFNIGPKQQNTLRRVILDLFSSRGEAPTISEVLEAYKEHADYDSVVGVLEGWVLGEVFAERGSGLTSLDSLMEDQVVVLSLLEFGSDQNSKNALVAMFLNLYYEYMARLPKWPYVGHSPQLRRLNSFLLVDEATNIMSYNFDALNSLMLQGREFGVGVILSSQYLSHFKSTKFDYAQALRTWFIHSVPNVTAGQLHLLGLPNSSEATAKRIVGLPTHHALYSSLGCDGRFIRGLPFYELMREARDGGSESE